MAETKYEPIRHGHQAFSEEQRGATVFKRPIEPSLLSTKSPAQCLLREPVPGSHRKRSLLAWAHPKATSHVSRQWIR